MSKAIVALLSSVFLFSANAVHIDLSDKTDPDHHVLSRADEAAEATVTQNTEAKVEEQVEQSDELKDPKKAKFFMQKAKEMEKLAKKEKQDGDKVEEYHYKNLALAYGMLSDGYKNGNQALIDKGNKLLSETQKQMGD